MSRSAVKEKSALYRDEHTRREGAEAQWELEKGSTGAREQ